MNLEIKAVAPNEAELLIYGYIGGWENRAAEFAKQVRELKATTLRVRINSGGGSLFDGVAIYNTLKLFKGTTIVHIDGLAASAASIIAMAGDQRIMPANTMLMIHNTSVYTEGNTQDLQKTALLLAQLDEAMLNTYVNRTGQTPEKIKQMMDDETWLTAKDAKELGFATEITDALEVAASIQDKSIIINGVNFEGLSLDKLRGGILKDFTASTNKSPPPATSLVANFLPKEGAQVMLTVEAFQKEHKATYDEVYTAAYKAGQTAERARIKEIEELEALGHKDILAKAKFDTGATAADVSFLIMKAEAQQRKTHIENVTADAGVLNKITSTQTDPVGNTQEEKEDAAFLAVFEGGNK
ncbi:MAG: Clp protease ClpP [Burkholderiales bacterium]|nr:Clp protease ClpP [Burkholderiales bacterium]